jgi:hypothetical protein
VHCFDLTTISPQIITRFVVLFVAKAPRPLGLYPKYRYYFAPVPDVTGALQAGPFVLLVNAFVVLPGKQRLRHFQPILTVACAN